MSGIDSSHVVLIIASLAFMLTVALAAVTLGLTKERLDAARSASKGKEAGTTSGGARSAKSKSLQRFSSRMSVEDLMNENSAKSSSDQGAALDLRPGLPAPTDLQADEGPPAASSEDSESSVSNVNNKSGGTTGPVRGSVFFLQESDGPSSSAVADCGVKGSSQQAAAAE